MKIYLQILRILTVLTAIIAIPMALIGIGIPILVASYFEFTYLSKALSIVGTNFKLSRRDYVGYQLSNFFWMSTWIVGISLLDSFNRSVSGFSFQQNVLVISGLIVLTLVLTMVSGRSLESN